MTLRRNVVLSRVVIPPRGLGRFRDTSFAAWHLRLMATPSDPRSESTTAGARPTKPFTELERELQRAAEEIERGECSVLSVEDVDRWAETGVPPWPDDFRG
jgi:hypothetical protein